VLNGWVDDNTVVHTAPFPSSVSSYS
jgi:hypothetical protein